MPPSSSLLVDGRALLDADRVVAADLADRRASFEVRFGELSPHVGFVVVAGVETLLESLQARALDRADISSCQRTAGLSDALCARLEALELRVDINAVPDGTIAFARAPIATVEGTLLETLLVGALVRSSIERGSAIATRAARLSIAAAGDAIIDASSALEVSEVAALAAARAAHVGGASATTHALAARKLGIHFRAAPRADLDAVIPHAETPSAWDMEDERLFDLGRGDDEEAVLLEHKRTGVMATGWLARGLVNASTCHTATHYELVALEEGGAWQPRRGGTPSVIPGRKMVFRYADTQGNALLDVVHLDAERARAPASVGAASVAPLARTVMRGGRTLGASESSTTGRARALAARRNLPEGVTRLRYPDRYPVDLSEGVRALREGHSTTR